ncbi:MAG: DUF3040 domain-containing protein [Acidimicrobiales bacterium]
MPLSEHEQKILSDLEESLSQQDPRFAKRVKNKVFVHARRRVRGGVVGFIGGLAILIVFFTQSILWGLVGVVVMLLSSIVVARNAELRGRAPSSRQRHQSE